MRCNHGLAQSQPAVSRGYFAVGEYLEAVFLQAGLQVREQVDVVERSSAEADAVDASCLPDQLRHLFESSNQTVMKPLAYRRRRRSEPKVSHDRFECSLRIGAVAIRAAHSCRKLRRETPHDFKCCSMLSFCLPVSLGMRTPSSSSRSDLRRIEELSDLPEDKPRLAQVEHFVPPLPMASAFVTAIV
jgi:hypothetical protein